MSTRVTQEPVWGTIVIRLAVAGDRAALQRLAEIASATPPRGPVVMGEISGRVVAALALEEDRLIADPFTATAHIAELVRVRAAQLRPSATTCPEADPLPDRNHGGR